MVKASAFNKKNACKAVVYLAGLNHYRASLEQLEGAGFAAVEETIDTPDNYHLPASSKQPGVEVRDSERKPPLRISPAAAAGLVGVLDAYVGEVAAIRGAAPDAAAAARPETYREGFAPDGVGAYLCASARVALPAGDARDNSYGLDAEMIKAFAPHQIDGPVAMELIHTFCLWLKRVGIFLGAVRLSRAATLTADDGLLNAAIFALEGAVPGAVAAAAADVGFRECQKARDEAKAKSDAKKAEMVALAAAAQAASAAAKAAAAAEPAAAAAEPAAA